MYMHSLLLAYAITLLHYYHYYTIITITITLSTYMYMYSKPHTNCQMCSLLWFAAVVMYAYTVVFVTDKNTTD